MCVCMLPGHLLGIRDCKYFFDQDILARKPRGKSILFSMLYATCTFDCPNKSSYTQRKPVRPAMLRKNTSMMSDGTGAVKMDKLVEGQGKTKRAKNLDVYKTICLDIHRPN